jgi:hypothetical protein
MPRSPGFLGDVVDELVMTPDSGLFVLGDPLSFLTKLLVKLT